MASSPRLASPHLIHSSHLHHLLRLDFIVLIETLPRRRECRRHARRSPRALASLRHDCKSSVYIESHVVVFLFFPFLSFPSSLSSLCLPFSFSFSLVRARTRSLLRLLRSVATDKREVLVREFFSLEECTTRVSRKKKRERERERREV